MRRAPLLFAFFALAGCDKKISSEECTRLLDKYLDMTIPDDDLRGMPPSQASVIRDERKAASKAHPAYKKTHAQCTAEVSQKQYECAMATHNADEWQACID
jgi:hypothetical protein